MQIPYYVSVGPGVQVASDEFAAKVAAVLQDPRGWTKYGYSFVQAPPARGGLHIHLELADEADRLCRASGFSCSRPQLNDIVIHLGNWMGGSASRLPLERYRNYVINHEVGHALGLPHQKCPAAECARRGMGACPASVMQQMTRGPAHVSPCFESDWPLDPEWGIDDPRRAAPAVPAAAPATPAAPAVVLAVLAVLAVIAVIAVLAFAGSRSNACGSCRHWCWASFFPPRRSPDSMP